MVKIKSHLFESIAACTIFPNIVFIFTTMLLIISLIYKQSKEVYVGILISYLLCVTIFVLSIIACVFFNKKSKKEIAIDDNLIITSNKIYRTDQIDICEYYRCKWYCIPIVYIYKQQRGGLFYIKFKNGERIKFYIFYSDYQKIKQKVKNITVK